MGKKLGISAGIFLIIINSFIFEGDITFPIKRRKEYVKRFKQ